jgi:hypothetical protein
MESPPSLLNVHPIPRNDFKRDGGVLYATTRKRWAGNVNLIDFGDVGRRVRIGYPIVAIALMMQLHHLIVHYPKQAPMVVTLSFILVANTFFLALHLHHSFHVKDQWTTAIPGDIFHSLFGVNLIYVVSFV